MNSNERLRIKVGTMTRSEYINLKNFPVSLPFRHTPPNSIEDPVHPTKIPVTTKSACVSNIPEQENHQKADTNFQENGLGELNELRMEMEALLQDHKNMQQNLEELKTKLKLFQAENEELKSKIDTLTAENGEKSGIIDHLEDLRETLEDEIQTLQENDRLKNPNRESELKEQIKRLQQENAKLEDELKKAQQTLDDSNLKADIQQTLRIHNDVLEAKENELNQLKESLDHFLQESRMKDVLFCIELERLHAILTEKVQQNNELKERLDTLEEKNLIRGPVSPRNRETNEKLKNSGISGEVSLQRPPSVTKEAQDLQNTIKQLEKEHQQELDNTRLDLKNNLDTMLKAALRENEASLKNHVEQEQIIKILLMIEIDRLHDVVQTLSDELEHLEDQCSGMRSEHVKEINALQNKIEEYQSSNKPSTERFDPDSNCSNPKILVHQNQSHELENAVKTLQTEIGKLSRDLSDKNAEIESLRAMNTQLEKKCNVNLDNLTKELSLKLKNEQDALENKHTPTTSVAMKEGTRSMIEKLVKAQQNRITELEEITNALQDEVIKAKRDSVDHANDVDKWKMKSDILEKKLQIEGIPIKYSQNKADKSSANPRQESELEKSLENENDSYKRWNNELLEVISKLKEDVANEKRDNFDKAIEIDAWKKKYFKLESSVNEDREKIKETMQNFLSKDGKNPSLLRAFDDYWNENSTTNSPHFNLERVDTQNQIESRNRGKLFPSLVKSQGRDHQKKPYLNAALEERQDPQRDSDHLVESKQIQPEYLNLRDLPSNNANVGVEPTQKPRSNFSDLVVTTAKSITPFDPISEHKLGFPLTRENRSQLTLNISDQTPFSDEYSLSGPNDKPRLDEDNFMQQLRNREIEQESLRQTRPNVQFARANNVSPMYGKIRNQSTNPSPNNSQRGKFNLKTSAPKENEHSISDISSNSVQITPRDITGHSPLLARKSPRGAAYTEERPSGIMPNHFDSFLKAANLKIDQPNAQSQYLNPSYTRNLDSTRLEEPSANEIYTASSQNLDCGQQRLTPLSCTDENRFYDEQKVIPGLITQAVSSEYLKNLQQNEIRLVLMSVELERLSNILKLKDENVQRLQEKLSEQENKYDDLRLSNLTSQPILRDLATSQNSWNGERVGLERQLNLQKEILRDYEIKVRELTLRIEELQRENGQLAASERNLKFELEKAKLNYETSLKQVLAQEMADQSLKFAEERKHLEDTLRDEKVKSQDLENKAIYLMKENGRLSCIIEERDKDIDKLLKDNKARARELQDMHNQLIGSENKYHIAVADLRKQFEEEKETQLSQQATKIKADHQVELKRLKDEIQHLQVILAGKDDKIQEMKENLEHLTQALQEREKEIDRLTDTLKRAEEKYHCEQETQRLESARQLKATLDSELKKLSEREAIEKNALELENQRLQDKCDELTSQLKESDSLVNKLEKGNTEQAAELDFWKRTCEQQERNKQLEINNFRDEYEIKVKNQLQAKINEMVKDFEKERSSLDDSLKKCRLRIQELEIQCFMLMIELDRQSSLRANVEKELTDLHQKELEKQQQHQEELEELKSQFERMLKARLELEAKESDKRLHRERALLEGQISDLQNHQAELEGLIQDLKCNNAKLSEELTRLRREKKDLIEKCNSLEQARSQLENNLSTIQSENERIGRERNNLLGKIESLEQIIHQIQAEQEKKIAVLMNENKCLQDEVTMKENALRNLRDQFEKTKQEMINHVNNLKHQFETTKRQEIAQIENKANQEIEKLFSELERVGNHLEEREQHISNLQKELEAANYNLRIKLQENEKLREQLNEIHKEYKKKLQDQSEAFNDEKRKELNTLLAEQTKLFEKEKQNLLNQLNEMNHFLQQLSNEKDRRQAEINELKQILVVLKREKEQALTDLKEKLDKEHLKALERAEKSFGDTKSTLEQKIKELSQSLQESSTRNMMLNSEIQRLNALVQSKMREVEELREEVDKVESEKDTALDQLQSHFDLFRKSSVGVGDYEVRYKAEKSALESQLLELHGKLAQAQENIMSLEKENKRLKEPGNISTTLASKQLEIQQKIDELDQVKKKYEEAMKNMSIAPIINMLQSKPKEKGSLSSRTSRLGENSSAYGEKDIYGAKTNL